MWYDHRMCLLLAQKPPQEKSTEKPKPECPYQNSLCRTRRNLAEKFQQQERQAGVQPRFIPHILRRRKRMVAGEIQIAAPREQVTVSPSPIISNETSAVDAQNRTAAENYVGDMIVLKVKDVLGVASVYSHTLIYSPYVTFGELISDVAQRFELAPETFDLTYQDKTDIYELAQMPLKEPITAANLLPSREKEYAVAINKRKRSKASRSSSRSAAHNDSLINYEAIQDYQEPVPSRRDFVGLKNKNMTCYLNSMLQSLWFTPEFRNLVYVYIHNPERYKKKSICVPLQKLFLKLQFSVRESIETDELTSTFGWNSRDQWHQHDIEELCNLLMENLSMEFKGTPLEGMIEALYFGAFNDYVKCLECQNRNVRDAAFLVLPLPIRNFGAQLENATLEEALKTFVTPELLDGNNQYNCSACAKPCDAHKGFSFKRLPYILSIQLKRFEFDWNTGRKFKLNDKIVFPMVLDMNPYMDKSSDTSSAETDASGLKSDILKPRNQGDNPPPPRTSHSRSHVPLDRSAVEEQNVSEEKTPPIVGIGSSRESVLFKLNEVHKTQGPDVYQLFAVLVHRGGLTGGHYFAYILDFETYRWYKCDDAYVRKADVEDIEASFGGNEEDKEPTSAYMLLYRRYDPQINGLPFLLEEMPTHIQQLWTSMVESEKQAQEEEELERNTIRVSVHYRVPGSWDVVSAEINIPKAASTLEAAFILHKHFFPDQPELSQDRIRLCRFDKDQGCIENSFENNDEQYITYTLKNPPPVTKNEGLILEIRKENEKFTNYTPQDIVFITQLVDYKIEDLVRVEEVHASPLSTVGNLKTIISRKLGLPAEKLVIVFHTDGKTVNTVNVDSDVLSNLGLAKTNYIFVQAVDGENMDEFLSFIDNYVNCIIFELEVQIPPTETPDTVFTLQNSDDNSEEESLATANAVITPEKKDNNQVVVGHCVVGEIQIPIIIEGTQPTETIPLLNGHVDPAETTALETNKANTIPDFQVPEKTVSEIESQPPIHPIRRAKKFLMKIKNEQLSGQYLNCILRVDGRIPLTVFSEQISKLMKVKETDFIIYKIDKEQEVEILQLRDCLNKIAPFEKIRIRLGHRLQKDEGRVAVFLMNLNLPVDNCTFAGDVALNPLMTAHEAKEMVLKECREALDGIDTTNCRIRKRNMGTPSKIFRDWTKVSDVFNYIVIHGAEIYLQILDAPAPVEDKCYPILLRRWRCSELVLDPPTEVIIFYDHSENVEKVILDKLKELTGLSDDNIEVAKPDAPYPYDMNPLAIQNLVWFPLTTTAKKSLYVYNDELALFVRDKSELMKALTPEEENKYRDENERNSDGYYGTPYGLSPPKRETGLKINLARSPPSS